MLERHDLWRLLLHVFFFGHHDDVYNYDNDDTNHDNDRIRACHLYDDNDIVLLRSVDKRRLRARRMHQHADVPGARMHAVGMRLAEQVHKLHVVHFDYDDNDCSPGDDYDHGSAGHNDNDTSCMPVQLHNGVGVLDIERNVQERIFVQLGVLLLHRGGDHNDYDRAYDDFDHSHEHDYNGSVDVL